MHTLYPAQCSLGLLVLNSRNCRDLRTYLTFPLALTNHQQPLSQCKSYYRFLPLHDWQCTVHCVCLLSNSLASRGTQNMVFAMQKELRSHVPDLPADKNTVSPLTSQAGSSGSADSRNMN